MMRAHSTRLSSIHPNIRYSVVGSNLSDTIVASVNDDVFDGRTNASGDHFGGDRSTIHTRRDRTV